MDRSDQYPDLAECKHGFVRRRIYSVILGRVAALLLLAWPGRFSVFSRSHVTSVKSRGPHFGGGEYEALSLDDLKR